MIITRRSAQNVEPVIEIAPYALSRTKRALDMGIALCALLVTALVFPFVFVSTKLTSRGPVFYRQTRIGMGGSRFVPLKFRTMKVEPRESGGSSIARSSDSRVTFAGKVLRKIHLDEFPQCINVLKGEMSLVGPRPFIEEECEAHSPAIEGFDLRHLILPGITGLAQINYDHANSEEGAKHKLGFDLEYIQQCSLRMDLIIIAKTLVEGFRMRGV